MVVELRIMPSDPQFEEVFFVADCIAKWTNFRLFFDLRDTPEEEQRAEVNYYKDWLEELSH